MKTICVESREEKPIVNKEFLPFFVLRQVNYFAALLNETVVNYQFMQQHNRSNLTSFRDRDLLITVYVRSALVV